MKQTKKSVWLAVFLHPTAKKNIQHIFLVLFRWLLRCAVLSAFSNQNEAKIMAMVGNQKQWMWKCLLMYKCAIDICAHPNSCICQHLFGGALYLWLDFPVALHSIALHQHLYSLFLRMIPYISIQNDSCESVWLNQFLFFSLFRYRNLCAGSVECHTGHHHITFTQTSELHYRNTCCFVACSILKMHISIVVIAFSVFLCPAFRFFCVSLWFSLWRNFQLWMWIVTEWNHFSRFICTLWATSEK